MNIIPLILFLNKRKPHLTQQHQETSPKNPAKKEKKQSKKRKRERRIVLFCGSKPLPRHPLAFFFRHLFFFFFFLWEASLFVRRSSCGPNPTPSLPSSPPCSVRLIEVLSPHPPLGLFYFILFSLLFSLSLFSFVNPPNKRKKKKKHANPTNEKKPSPLHWPLSPRPLLLLLQHPRRWKLLHFFFLSRWQTHAPRWQNR